MEICQSSAFSCTDFLTPASLPSSALVDVEVPTEEDFVLSSSSLPRGLPTVSVLEPHAACAGLAAQVDRSAMPRYYCRNGELLYRRRVRMYSRCALVLRALQDVRWETRGTRPVRVQILVMGKCAKGVVSCDLVLRNYVTDISYCLLRFTYDQVSAHDALYRAYLDRLISDRDVLVFTQIDFSMEEEEEGAAALCTLDAVASS